MGTIGQCGSLLVYTGGIYLFQGRNINWLNSLYNDWLIHSFIWVLTYSDFDQFGKRHKTQIWDILWVIGNGGLVSSLTDLFFSLTCRALIFSWSSRDSLEERIELPSSSIVDPESLSGSLKDLRRKEFIRFESYDFSEFFTHEKFHCQSWIFFV